MKIPPLKITFSDTDIKKITSEVEMVLKSGWLTLGRMTKRFEKEFACTVQRRFAVALSTGTTALEVFLRIQNVEGKNVVVPTNTNYATAAAVLFAGGDIKLADGALFPLLECVKAVVDKNTAGIVIVHIGGYMTEDMDEFRLYCEKNKLFLLEDAAHAHGASISGKKAGSFGQAAAFSFFPTKVITSGEGGMLVTDDQDVYEKALILRDQGKDVKTHEHVLLGNSWRMSELQAIIGFHQLKHLQKFVQRRNKIMKYYSDRISDLSGVEIYERSCDMIPSGYKYVIRLSTSELRDRVKSKLQNQYGIFTGGGVYDVPVHKLPVFAGIFGNGSFSQAEHFCSTHLCLPIWSTMRDEEAEYVIDSLTEIMS